jgi:hypothetical protein
MTTQPVWASYTWHDNQAGVKAQAAQLDKDYPNTGAGNALLTWAQAHPDTAIGKEEATIIAEEALGGALSGAARGVAADTAGIGAITGSTLENQFSLDISNVAGWFFRGLKILFGGVLMIIGISKITGVDNKITQLASNAIPALTGS